MKYVFGFSDLDNQAEYVIRAYDTYLVTNRNTLLDFISGLYNVPLGYSCAEVKRAVCETLATLPACHTFSTGHKTSQSHELMQEFSEKMAELVPFGSHFVCSNSGSEANEIALKICAQLGKTTTLSYRNSYHGSTLASFSISGNLNAQNFQNHFIDFFGVNTAFSKKEYLELFERTVVENKVNVFIAEPVIGANGAIIMKENVLPEIEIICKRNNVIFILDEVITGFFRLGKMFAFDVYGIKPDIITFSKQITNGYLPMGITVFSDTMDLDRIGNARFGFTTAGNPPAVAAALAAINEIQRTNLPLVEFKSMMDYLACVEGVNHVSMCGMFGSVEVHQDLLDAQKTTKAIADRCRQKGLVVRGSANRIIFAPPYVARKEHFSDCANIIKEALNEC